MKKWILLALLYLVGGLYIYDVHEGYPWMIKLLEFIRESELLRQFFSGFLLLFVIYVLLVLCNYMLLRIRGTGPIFTLLNGLFIPLFIITNNRFDEHIVSVVKGEVGLFDSDFMIFMYVSFIVVTISGIIISEAKTKRTYLTAEFIFLFTSIILLFVGMF